MRRGGGGGYGRGGGGLYGNFVSANDNVMNKAYRGAEIPPPPSLNSGNNTSNSVRGGGAPRLGPNTPIVGITTAAEGLSKHGYSTMSSISESSLSYSQYGVSIKRARTEDEYFNSDDEKEAPAEDDGGYQPAPGSPGAGDEEEDDPLDAYMKELEKEAITKGTTEALVVN